MTLDADLYAPEVLADSRALFAEIRDAGPVVRLPRNGLWAMGRFDDVRAALRDDATFTSGHGVAANRVANRTMRTTVLGSDGEVHTARRRVMMRALGAKALGDVRERIDAEADALVAGLVGRGEIDAVADFATVLPVRVVADLVGVRVGHERMLDWAAGTFDALGPMNRRGLAATPRSVGLLFYGRRLSRARVVPGGWASGVLDAADRGELTRAEAQAMIIDFVAPSLDTTILAAAQLLHCLGTHPEAYARIRADHSLIPAAVLEAVRLASPVRGFTRLVARDTGALRAGDRVALLFGAANLDPRRFPDPGRFDLDRPAGGHLGWGNGPHTCVGIHLAKLELRALLTALVAHVGTITIGAPTRIRNNTLQGIASLPARLEPA